MYKRGISKGFQEIIVFLLSWYRCSFRGRNTDHSRPLSAEIKNERSFTTVSTICLCGRDKESFIFLLLGSQEGNGVFGGNYFVGLSLSSSSWSRFLTISGLIPEVHLRNFHLCDLEFLTSFGRYYSYVSKSLRYLFCLFVSTAIMNVTSLTNVNPPHTDGLATSYKESAITEPLQICLVLFCTKYT
jgi:hypothetical protein